MCKVGQIAQLNLLKGGGKVLYIATYYIYKCGLLDDNDYLIFNSRKQAKNYMRKYLNNYPYKMGKVRQLSNFNTSGLKFYVKYIDNQKGKITEKELCLCNGQVVEC